MLDARLWRTDEGALERELGLRLSTHAVLLRGGLTVEEQIEIQRNPLLMRQDASLRSQIIAKVENPGSWIIVQRPAADLEIHLCDSTQFADSPGQYRAVWPTEEEAERNYRHIVWTLTELPTGGSRILNIGSKTGHEAVLIREQDPARQLYSLDILEECAMNARAAKGAVAVGSALTLPYRDGVFEGIYSNNVLEHFYDVDQALSEFYRVLAPSGVVISILPTETNMTNPFMKDLFGARRRWCSRRLDAGHPFKTDLHDLDCRFRETGFRRIIFVYEVRELRARMALVSARGDGPVSLRRALEWGLFQLQTSSVAFKVEHAIRSLFQCWRFRNYPLWLVEHLGLPNKSIETLEVACVAYK